MSKTKIGLLGLLLLLAGLAYGQTFTPVPVTGYNHDAIAETYPNSLATTDTVLDASAYVLYSQAFATAGGLGGGLPNNGIITDAGNTRQYQLGPYNGLNVLNVMRTATKTLSLTVPAVFQKLSLLTFSTEGPSTVNVTVDFTDGTSTAYITNYTLPDWFNNTTNVAYSGFGRVTRQASVTATDGLTTNPRFYYIDITLNCADKKKQVQALRVSNVTTTGTNAPYPNTVLMALSGQANTQAITPTITQSSCGAANGSATVNITGNTGPYTVSWNTTPAQTTNTITNLLPGIYTATVTDGGGCTTTQAVTVTQLASPSGITATATPATVCAGTPTQLAVSATGGSLASFSWLPTGGTAATATVSPTITTTYTVQGLDNAGCPYSRQVTVVVNQVPAAPVVPNVPVCNGRNGTLSVQSPQAGYTYTWYSSAAGGTALGTGATFPVNNVTAPATYYVSASANSCTSSTRTAVQVSVLAVPQVNAGPDITIIVGDVYQMIATGSNGSYQWTPATGLSAANVLNPTAQPTVTTTYTLAVTDPSGCVSTDDMVITVLPYCVKPMEAFTPNGDGQNDLWLVTNGACLEYASVGVYNRYGAPVYENSNYKNNWDGTYNGKPLPDGTYYFIINYKLINGKGAYARGTVTILR